MFAIHGSEDSLDKDMVYFVEQMPKSRQACQDMCLSSDPNENKNICMVQNGICVACFKGLPDELNNSLLVTYPLHEQQFELPIKQTVKRIILLKVSIYCC